MHRWGDGNQRLSPFPEKPLHKASKDALWAAPRRMAAVAIAKAATDEPRPLKRTLYHQREEQNNFYLIYYDKI
jgi:hypothetical protein